MDTKPLTEKEWDRFFDLLDKIMDLPGAWKEKADEVATQATTRGSETALSEFLGWFPEER